MKLRFGTRPWLIAAWILIGLFSGPAVVVTVWVVAALAAAGGFVVLPGHAPRYGGPQGREADVSEIYVTSMQSGGSIGLLKQIIAPKSGPPTHVHSTEDEFFYVLKGDFKVKLGDKSWTRRLARSCSCRGASRTLFRTLARTRRVFGRCDSRWL